MMLMHSNQIAKKLGFQNEQVKSAIELLEGGATIPFIARYRKDQTGGLEDFELIAIQQEWKQVLALDNRRNYILQLLGEKELLNDDLKREIDLASTLSELEDLFLPYKTKRQSRAEKARQLGLEPLAKMIMAQGDGQPEEMAKRFVRLDVKSMDDALSGATDIMAEWISEHVQLRRKLRKLFSSESVVSVSVVKGKEQDDNQFRDYFKFSEPVSHIKPHRTLAINRGEQEGVLKISVVPERERAMEIMGDIFIRNRNSAALKWIEKAMAEAYSRLLRPALQNEVRTHLKELADQSAIQVFNGNLRQLLMAPPLGRKRVLAIDPGFKSGCKVVCIDEQGQLLGHDTMFPHAPQRKTNAARNTLNALVKTHNIEVIAVGNGTAGRETEAFIKQTQFKRELAVYMVSEDGASVYSASSVGRKEFPNHDVTIRGAVSIGRRLMDPLAELVKIDPRSIGVGQYQHDVNEKKLQEALDLCVQLVVNEVGVELNTASPYLLAHVSGLTPRTAESIVAFRNKQGPLRSRTELLNVSGVGAKAFEQCAGFLRIADADNPLDNTAVHPESYSLVEKMARRLGANVSHMLKDEELMKGFSASDFEGIGAGHLTVEQILTELRKRGRDPRRMAYVVDFDPKIKHPEDLVIGNEMWGIITNITQFGAFVDLGVKQDGLVHISELADRFVADPFEIVRISQPVKVKILSVDLERKRIALSMKQATILKPPV